MTTVESIFTLFLSLLSKEWILQTLAFVILAGSIMALIEKSGGVGGFVEYVLHKKALVKSERSALMLSYFLVRDLVACRTEHFRYAAHLA
jgi:tetracycline resistance efflux pump